MFSKFKIEKAPNALYRHEPSHFEIEQSAISLPLLEAYDQRIRHLRAENEQLRAEKVEHVKIINGQATELAKRRAVVFKLRQELQFLRHEVSQKKNTVKFNISRKSYWDVDRAARSLKRKKIGDYLRNAAKSALGCASAPPRLQGKAAQCLHFLTSLLSLLWWIHYIYF